MQHNFVSIHAPARGATAILLLVVPLVPVSIHAPARGATRYFKWSLVSRDVSIHAPARGATGIPRVWRKIEARFNPRARAGRDAW